MKTRLIKKWAMIWPVNYSNDNDKTYWVFFESFYEYQRYHYWNDYQEGVGNNWKCSWQCIKQIKFKDV
jgi:hypothetical protein